MGQLALGFRSLIIRTAVFVVMAGALAWALGGTLFPRAEVVDYPAVTFEGREYFWRLFAGGREGGAKWRLFQQAPGEKPQPANDRTWVDVAGPVASTSGLHFGGRSSRNSSEPWRIESLAGATVEAETRLEVEYVLAEARRGRSLEEAAASFHAWREAKAE